jgi:PHD/YefM family antitoxin component YafN of YafNO toxin-antitoxin module
MEMISSIEASANMAAVIAKAQHAPVMLSDPQGETAVVVSRARYEFLRGKKVAEIDHLAKISTDYAQNQGLTPELLEALLAQRRD